VVVDVDGIVIAVGTTFIDILPKLVVKIVAVLKIY